MNEFRLPSSGRVLVSGVPEGYDALVLATYAAGDDAPPGGVLHVARDDARMARLAESVAFFAPGLEIVRLPAWDCLPYDRVSPNGEITAERIAALARLAGAPEAPAGGRLVITTVNATLQRMPSRAVLNQAVWQATIGDRIDLEELTGFLVRNGYERAGTVREAGEFALRGGIVDIFPPGGGDPVRIDLFGDEIEGIRSFDPVSQMTEKRLESVALRPVSEVFFDPESISRFRSGYRELFGAVANDPLYEAVSEGRKSIGVEHWLPLFHETLETLFDYLPGAAVTLDNELAEARKARLETIADYYDARVSFLNAAPARGAAADSAAPPYRPLPPDRLYLDEDSWDACLARRAVAQFYPFTTSPELGSSSYDAIAALGGRRVIDFAAARAQAQAGAAPEGEANLFAQLRDYLGAQTGQGRRTIIAAFTRGSAERLRQILEDNGVTDLVTVTDWTAACALPPNKVAVCVLGLEHGFAADDVAVVGEQDILGDRLVRSQRRPRRAEDFIADVGDLSAGDYVVHIDHGIGRYDGLETVVVSGAPHDCLRLTYDGDDRLYVPVENIEVLSRYGSRDNAASLDRLGGAGWQGRKSRLKKRLLDMAGELIEIAAQRALKPAPVVLPPEGTYDAFCARFPFNETEDQIRAIDDTLADLSTGRPMDRLVCGDVGFGKTEIALRAAFATVMGGGQVAVVVPTTLLCRQHFATFRERFARLPVRIEQLSRMVTQKRASETRRDIANGEVDIVVGTHALLVKNIAFRNLTLLVVDEEQHFGVAHKERLKQLKSDVHVLTLTATPIPRTLQLALTGVKEMSMIATPPVDRLAVRTFVMPYDPVVLREAIMREHFRGGQTFYVCPRILDLDEVAARLREIAPEIRVGVAHGRMPTRALEEVMTAFYEGQINLLLSTQIVESGLDIPSANTLIIHRADMFGLAQLYQLRGRVGRSKLRAYCYLTLPADRALTEAAQKRLEVMQTLDRLGAGFTLASHDLDIRGAGNLLGDEQSGHIREVGVELYQQMLEEAVAQARGGAAAVVESWVPQINVGIPVLIPEPYVSDLGVRLGLYRRISGIEDDTGIEAFAAELIDRFGPIPPEVENLLKIVAIKRLCRIAGVEKLDAGPKGAVVSFRDNQFANPAGLIAFITDDVGRTKLRPDHRLVYRRDWVSAKSRLTGAQGLLRTLAGIAQAEAA